MLAQALDVAHLEPGVAASRDTTDADLVQLAVGEHVPVDEAAAARTAVARAPAGELIPWFSSRPSGREQPVQAPEVLVELRRADVLEHADRADRVERTVVDVAVVLDADLDEVGEPGSRAARCAATRPAAATA